MATSPLVSVDIPGDDTRVSDSATGLLFCAEEIEAAADAMVDCKPDWSGMFADAYSGRVDEWQAKLLDIASRCREGAAALLVFAAVLSEAKSEEHALRLQAIGSGADEDVEAYNQRVKELEREVYKAAFTAALALIDLTNDQNLDDFDGRASWLSDEDIERINQDIEDLQNGTFSWANSRQGGIGDCYLQASLCALCLSKAGQAAVADSIRWDEDAGVFIVTLHTEEGPVDIRVFTTYDQGIGYTWRDVGVLDMMEMAYGKHYGWQGLNSEGRAADAMQIVSGCDTQVERAVDGQYSGGQWETISQAATANQPMIATGSDTLVTDTSGTQVEIHGHHIYTVVGVGTDWVTVWNPWGRNDVNNYPSGLIQMSREEFERAFPFTTIGELE
ncbi:MAG: hypothetical protein LBR58_09980 [Propionibacteriaceae bacterium]|jgi:hypothetical protein|nr:hypothetical protein [Propionibacteriaceae bacterium]